MRELTQAVGELQEQHQQAAHEGGDGDNDGDDNGDGDGRGHVASARSLVQEYKTVLQRLLDVCSFEPHTIELLWTSPVLTKMLILDTSQLLDGGDDSHSVGSVVTEDRDAGDVAGAVVASTVTGVAVVTLRFVKRLVALHEQRQQNQLLPQQATLALFYELLHRFAQAIDTRDGDGDGDGDGGNGRGGGERVAVSSSAAAVSVSMEALMVIYTLCLHDGTIVDEIRCVRERVSECVSEGVKE